jgi:hypothetical protein
MNCNDIRTEIATRGVDARPLLAEHVAGCDLCRAWLDDHRLRLALVALPVPEPSPGFVDRVLQAATGPAASAGVASAGSVEATTPTQGTWPGVASAPRPGLEDAAAVLVTVTVALLALVGGRGAPDMAEMRTQIVNVVIEAGSDRADALLTVELTEGLELDGFGEQRRVEWHAELIRGRNLLALPVRGRAGTAGDIRVSLSYDGVPGTEIRIPVGTG